MVKTGGTTQYITDSGLGLYSTAPLKIQDLDPMALQRKNTSDQRYYKRNGMGLAFPQENFERCILCNAIQYCRLFSCYLFVHLKLCNVFDH